MTIIIKKIMGIMSIKRMVIASMLSVQRIVDANLIANAMFHASAMRAPRMNLNKIIGIRITSVFGKKSMLCIAKFV